MLGVGSCLISPDYYYFNPQVEGEELALAVGKGSVWHFLILLMYLHYKYLSITYGFFVGIFFQLFILYWDIAG